MVEADDAEKRGREWGKLVATVEGLAQVVGELKKNIEEDQKTRASRHYTMLTALITTFVTSAIAVIGMFVKGA